MYNLLSDIAFDPLFVNLYVPDRSHHVVRRINIAMGIINRVAGASDSTGCITNGAIVAVTKTLLNDPRGVAFDTVGNLYVSNRASYNVRTNFMIRFLFLM